MGAGTSSDPRFSLLFRDDFEQLNLARWKLMTHSWDSNLALFSDETATIEDGQLVISLLRAPEGTVDSSNNPKPFLGAEVRSSDTLTYGRVRARMKFAQGSAVVSSLVTIYTPWPADDWNELDIEFLGKNSDRIQFNHMVNIPPADPASGHLQFPEMVTLAFDPAADFHTYTIEWQPGEARFLVDGELWHTASEEMARMVLPQNILLTIWASDSAAWAGAVDETTAPTAAVYDWIRVYDYVPPS